MESLIVLYDEERQFYESSEHEENINNIFNQLDEAIQIEPDRFHTSLGMVLPPKKNLQDIAVKQLSVLSKSLDKATLISQNKKKSALPCKFSFLNFWLSSFAIYNLAIFLRTCQILSWMRNQVKM